MLAVNLGEDGVGVAVLAGIDEIVVVGGATNTSAHVVEKNVGQLFEDDLCGQRGGKALSRNVVAQVRCWASLFLEVPRKGIAQVQDRGGIERKVVSQKKVAPVGRVLGIVGVPATGEDIGSGEL